MRRLISCLFHGFISIETCNAGSILTNLKFFRNCVRHCDDETSFKCVKFIPGASFSILSGSLMIPFANNSHDWRRNSSPPNTKPMFDRREWLSTVSLLWMLLVPLVLGCSKEEMSQALESAKSKTKAMTASAVEAVEDKLPESGSITLDRTPQPVTISQADITLISVGDGRPNVVQITSYNPSSASRSYPALLLHGITNLSTASSLEGEKIACDLYLQESETSPITMTEPGHAIVVDFQQYNSVENTLTANLGMISLRGSDDSVLEISGGKVLAVIRGENK